jgi:hypothetical protein
MLSKDVKKNIGSKKKAGNLNVFLTLTHWTCGGRGLLFLLHNSFIQLNCRQVGP